MPEVSIYDTRFEVCRGKLPHIQKKENNPAIRYLKSTVDFSLLEQMHDKFIEKKNN